MYVHFILSFLMLATFVRCIEFGICRPSHHTDECGTRPFLRLVRAQCRSPDAPDIPKNALGPVGIILKMGASGEEG